MAKTIKSKIYYYTKDDAPLTCVEQNKHPQGVSKFVTPKGKEVVHPNYYIFEEPNQLMVLHLTLTKQWFDLIASGDKKEEYRDVKLYFGKRFLTPMGSVKLAFEGKIKKGEVIKYDIIRFTNGYQKDAPQMDVVWKGLKGGNGKQKWGAEKDKKYFVIKLGKIKSIRNYV